jgi:hypothetical protein
MFCGLGIGDRSPLTKKVALKYLQHSFNISLLPFYWRVPLIPSRLLFRHCPTAATPFVQVRHASKMDAIASGFLP